MISAEAGIRPGAHLKEVAARDRAFHDCLVLSVDDVGLAFDVQRAVKEGGDPSTVTSRVFVPWSSLSYILVEED